MKKTRFFFVSLLALLLFSSCSYAEFEDNLSGKIVPKGNAQASDTDDAQVSGSVDFGDQYTNDTDQLQLKKIGDEIVVDDGVSEMSYTVNSVTVYDTYEDAGLTQEDIYGYVPDSANGNIFVLLDITVKNLKASSSAGADHNIGVFHLLNQNLLADPWSQVLPGIVYFSGSTSMDSSYYHYTIDEGEEKRFQIGWILYDPVSTAQDLILHVGADISLENYVDLAETP